MGALNAESPKLTFKKIKKISWLRIIGFLMDLHHILHARTCLHFQWFPHARWHPRPLQRPQNVDLLLGALGAMVPWCHSGAMYYRRKNTELNVKILDLLSDRLKAELTVRQRRDYFVAHPLLAHIHKTLGDVFAKICGAFNTQGYFDGEQLHIHIYIYIIYIYKKQKVYVFVIIGQGLYI